MLGINRRLIGLVAAATLAAGAPARAQDPPEAGELRQVLNGLASSFSVPLRDLLKKKHDSEWRNLTEGFAGSFGVDGPLKAPAIPGRGQTLKLTDARVSASLKYTPIGYWFASGSIYRYLNAANQRAWSPDFTYVVGYDDWHPYTLSLTYANYGGNRFDPDRNSKGQRTDLAEGGITLGWKLQVPKALDRAMAVTGQGGAGLSVHYTWTPRYSDAKAQVGQWKQKAGVSAKYTVYKWLYATATTYYYPHAAQQQPWDPDFTYGFGFFDWHPGSVSIQYNNYAGNRFPWHRGPRASFRDGSVSMTWSWSATQ